MFQALARDRLERLNASPSATPWTYFRVYSVLLLVITSDLLWYYSTLLIFLLIRYLFIYLFLWGWGGSRVPLVVEIYLSNLITLQTEMHWKE